ncbi:MAG: CotH kinase family protein [Ruminococcus sp.]|jgi:spore coat protein H|nr:CotH kinase family protein [Ruminococcus sp.]
MADFMKKFKFRIVIAFILPIILLIGVFALSFFQLRLTADTVNPVPVVTEPMKIKLPTASPEEIAEDDKGVYTRDGYGDDTSVITMYLTARRGNEAENSDNEFDELARHSKLEYISDGTDPHRTECIIQEGDENGPKEGYYGYGVTAPNATVSIRGNSSSTALLKSYKITLHDGAKPWRSQTVINLNKHAREMWGFSQKLTCDIVKTIPGMFSLRTQFVHLYVKDETTGEENPQFVDYGLFTQLEQPNVSYLKNHGLDENGEFYKAEYFEFNDLYGDLKLVTDPLYKEVAFGNVIENKGRDNDHTNLINMVNDINDYTIPISETLERYFDEDNMMKWMASQILLGNTDVINRNYLLYSPPNSDKFYFIIYDCDGILSLNTDNVALYNDPTAQSLKERRQYQFGITNFFGVTLYERVFTQKEYVKKLSDMVEWMRAEYITNERVYGLAKEYAAICKPFRSREPETILFSEQRMSFYDTTIDLIPSLLDETVEAFHDSISGLTPFFIILPQVTEDGTLFAWVAAHNYAGLAVKYDLAVTRDVLATDIVFEEKDLSGVRYTYENSLPPGDYYIRMSASDAAGHFTYANEYVTDDATTKYYGVIAFTVKRDGSIIYT